MSEAISSTDQWVLVPGTLCTPDVFRPLLDRLGVPVRSCRYIVADAPTVEDYDARLRASVRGGEIVCGFSLGALILAHNLGALEKAKAVVLLSVNPFPDQEGNRANREATRDRILTRGARDWIHENWASMSTDCDDEVRQYVVSMAEDITELITVQTELAASRPGAEQALLNTKLPLVFVTGAADKMTPPDGLEAIAGPSGSALRVLEDLGHFALLESPDRVADAVMQGLEEVVLLNKESQNCE